MKSFLRLIAVCMLTVLLPQMTMAAVFVPDYIMSDYDLVNSDSMTLARIQSFLDAKGGLGAVTTVDPWGNTKTAAQIINEAAKYYRISAQYLIVRMQIEQSLITMASPTQSRLDWATGYGVCDSCSKDDPDVLKYKGFFSQVNWAARIIRNNYLVYLETYGNKNGWGPGITKTVTDQYGTFNVTPVNNATAAMYVYTPHVYNANYNVWYYFNKWFAKNYPDGSLLRAKGEAGVYVILNGKKRGFTSKAALVSRYNPSNIITVTRNELDAYEDGPRINLPNYSLVQSQETNKKYLIDGAQIRYIVSDEVFKAIGFNPEEVVVVSSTELDNYDQGTDITSSDNYPTGILLQSKQTGGISYIQDGVRHSIWSREIYRDRFAGQKPQKVDDSAITAYPLGAPVQFRDGTLVTSPVMKGGVYVISNGLRRPITSRKIFTAFGFKMKNVIKTSDGALLAHPLGDAVDIVQ